MLLQYGQSEHGLLHFCSKALNKYPASFNYWIGPFFSLPFVHHPDTVMPILSGNGKLMHFCNLKI